MQHIPFGRHKVTGRLLDARAVPKGLQCNCVCNECERDLEAVFRTRPRTINYFRHSAKSDCKGGLESLFHKVAKQIILENSVISTGQNQTFSYSHCDIEKGRYGKKPDAYLNNSIESLIVEIYFWHQIDNATIETYLHNGERVLEIDISSERKEIFDYEILSELVLNKAKRKLYEPGTKVTPSEPSDVPWWLWPLFIFIAGFFVWQWWKKYRRKRRTH